MVHRWDGWVLTFFLRALVFHKRSNPRVVPLSHFFVASAGTKVFNLAHFNG